MLTERNRAVLHRRLTDVVGDEEAVSEMLSNFPNDDRLRPVTDAGLAESEARLESRIDALGLRLVMWLVGLQVGAVGLVLAVIRSWLPT